MSQFAAHPCALKAHNPFGVHPARTQFAFRWALLFQRESPLRIIQAPTQTIRHHAPELACVAVL